MADKSMFSIEVETATFDAFKHNFDEYHAKLRESLALWKQIAAEINNAAGLVKGLGGGGGASSTASPGSAPATPSSISGMHITATGTVTFTATGTVNFAGGAGGTGGGGGTTPPKPPKVESPKTDKLLSGLGDKFGAVAQHLASGNIGGLLGLLRGIGPLGGVAGAVGAVASSAGDMADLRKQSMQLGGVVTPSELRAARIAGTWMNDPEGVMGSVVTARREITSDQRRAYQNLFGTEGGQKELQKDSGTAMFEGMEQAAKELMKMPEAVRDTQALNLKYAQTFGLGNLRMMEEMLSSPEGRKELEERRKSFKDFDSATKISPKAEKDATDFNEGWNKTIELLKMAPFTMWEGLSVFLHPLNTFKEMQRQEADPNAPHSANPWDLKNYGKDKHTWGEGIIGGAMDWLFPTGGPSHPNAPTPDEQKKIDEQKKVLDSVKKQPSPQSSAETPSPLSAYEAGSLGGVQGEIKTKDEEGTKVSKDMAVTMKEIRDSLKVGGGAGGGGGGDNRGGSGGGGSGPHSPGASGGAGSGGAGAGGQFSTKGAYDLIKAAGGTDEEARTLAAISQAESSGNPGAHNTNAKTGDNSYGLWQINMLGKMGPERLAHFGLKSNEDLFDPATNARVALQMSREGGGLGNWSTYRSGAYQKWIGGEKLSGGPSAGGGAGGKFDQSFFGSRAQAGVSNTSGLNSVFATNMQAAVKAAEAATGDKVRFTSLKRDYATQAKLYYDYIHHLNGQGLAAAPGTSLHEKGMAADLADGPALDWIRQHASEFGLHHLGMNDKGHIELDASLRSAAGPDASADAPSPDASAVAMSTSSQGGGFAVPGGNDTIELPTFDIKPSAPQTHVAHAAHHLAMAHHWHKRGHHRKARHHHHMARKHLHHLAKHHKGALAAVMKNSSIKGPGMGEFQPGDPRNPFGAAPTEKSAAGYIALKKYLETHKVGTEEWDQSGSAKFKAITDDITRDSGGYDKDQFDPVKKHPWGNMNPFKERPGGRYGPLPGKSSEQQASATMPLGLHNWQLAQTAAVNIHNKTGSDVFIAASTLTA